MVYRTYQYIAVDTTAIVPVQKVDLTKFTEGRLFAV